MATETIVAEVAYATPKRQTVIAVKLPAGSTVEQAIQASEIVQTFADIDLSKQKIGVFGSVCKLDRVLVDGDRVEIYRPLHQSPMEARRGRQRQ